MRLFQLWAQTLIHNWFPRSKELESAIDRKHRWNWEQAQLRASVNQLNGPFYCVATLPNTKTGETWDRYLEKNAAGTCIVGDLGVVVMADPAVGSTYVFLDFLTQRMPCMLLSADVRKLLPLMRASREPLKTLPCRIYFSFKSKTSLKLTADVVDGLSGWKLD